MALDNFRVGTAGADTSFNVQNQTSGARAPELVREVHEREVPSRFMGELIMLRLRQLHKVAYVRYASIYREFREPADFLPDRRPLTDQGPPGEGPSPGPS